MKISPEDIILHNIFPNKAYFRHGSRKLIEASRNGNLTVVDQLLQNNRYLVYDYDHVHQTALHWAAKRDHPKIVKVLLDHGSYIDCKDFGKRTPLFLASK